MCAGRVQPVAGHIVNIEIEACVRDRPVRENTRGADVLLRDGFQTLEMPRFAYTDQRGGFQQIAILISGHKFVQEIQNRLKLAAADKHRAGEICGIRTVNAGAVCHVAGDDTGKRRTVKQNVSGRERQIRLAERLNFALGDLHIVLKFAGENSAAVVHTADFEH